MTEHFITLSTTEPNNNIGIVKLRHADVNSQAIVAQIVENGQPKNFEGLQPFFCLMAQEVTGQGVSEESIVSFDSSKGTLSYIVSDNALQMVGRNEAYFSFRKQEGGRWIEQFSTRTFHYIVEKSIYSQPFKDSNYWWTFKELNRIFNQYIKDGKKSWEEFVNQNKEILESVDPGGLILSELIRSRKPAGADAPYKDVPERLDRQIGLNSDFRAFETENSFMKRVYNEFTERGINPEWYTLVSNNDTEKVQLAINDAINTKKELVLTKDYYIDGIVIDKSLIIRGNGHALYANKPGVEKFISIIETSQKTEEKTIQIYNLKVINKSNCIYGVFNDSSVLVMHHCLVEGFVTANVVGKPNSGGSFGNLNIDYLDSNLSENGILSLGATDHKIFGYMGYNCMTHINGLGGNSYLFHSHGWNYNTPTKNWINGSKFVAVKDSCIMSNIYADTVEIAVDLTAANNLVWALIAISNLGYFINRSTYPNQTETNGVPTPKIFTDLDLFNGQLNVTGMNVDFNNWLDKNNRKPKIASGKINTARMKFGGLNENGLNDVHGINLKKSQEINDYLSYDSTYLNKDSFKSFSQLGKTKMVAVFSLKRQVSSGVLISEITLKPTNITLSEVNIVTCDAIGWIADGTVYKLSARVSGDKIKIYNTSGQTITHGVEINVEVESYLC